MSESERIDQLIRDILQVLYSPQKTKVLIAQMLREARKNTAYDASNAIADKMRAYANMPLDKRPDTYSYLYECRLAVEALSNKSEKEVE